MVELQELFDVKYGVNLELNKLKIVKSGINFVSRSSKNNGVTAIVKSMNHITPIPSGTITVAGGGSVMEAFLQPMPYYSGRDLYYLTAKVEMTDAQKLFYCTCIRYNKYKYSYGRQANRTLKNLIVPSLSQIPDWVNATNLACFDNAKQKIFDKYVEVPKITEYATIDDLFIIKNGIAATGLKESIKKFKGSVMYVRPASTHLRTKRSFVSEDCVLKSHIYPKGTLFVSTNGEGSHTYSYVSTEKFIPNSDVSVLIPRKEMAIETKIFYSRCITANRYLFSYGRKPKGNKLKNISLPKVTKEHEDNVIKFIRSLEYSNAALN